MKKNRNVSMLNGFSQDNNSKVAKKYSMEDILALIQHSVKLVMEGNMTAMQAHSVADLAKSAAAIELASGKVAALQDQSELDASTVLIG